MRKMMSSIRCPVSDEKEVLVARNATKLGSSHAGGVQMRSNEKLIAENAEASQKYAEKSKSESGAPANRARPYHLTTMIKIVYCITKKPGCSDEEFFHYWKNVHGPIGARIPGLRRLVQSHRIAVPGDRRPPDYDGMAELWFDSIDAILRARESAEWKASTEDEEKFIDHSKTAYFVSEEHVIV
jgi:uncharacterized protein (TIGR02118 family)